jgi:ABC-type Fe3+-siderophore transport system permease subunit
MTSSTCDPLRTVTTFSVVVVIVGLVALAIGLMMHRHHGAVDVALEADRELLDRINSHKVTSSDSRTTLETYAHDSLEYHQVIRHLFRSIANTFLLCGAGLAIAGVVQLRALRTLRRRLASDEQPSHESPAT